MSLTMDSQDAMLNVRRRLRDDFDYYAQKALKIRTKDAQISPLKLNAAQQVLMDSITKQYAETGMVRIIILKGRQQGMSTMVGGYLYSQVSQKTAKKAIVVTHKSDSTTTLFNMTKRYHENIPEILKPNTSYSSRKELVFDKLDSSFMVATAGGDGIARGETITHAHLSELAFWKESIARENLNGLLQSIPETPDTAVFIESTASGVTGPFYEMWQGAEKGINGYLAVFVPWFIQKEYRTKCPPNFEKTPEEIMVAEKFGLDDEQVYWRRLKVNQNGLDMFKQEYPCEPDEAFLTTGRPVFDVESLTNRIRKMEGPIRRMALTLGEWEVHPQGELFVYKEIDPGETYYIGADVAMGVRDGDYSVAQILDANKNQCGVWRGRVHPDYYAEVLYKLGMLYGEAKIAVESNNHGLLTVNNLYKIWSYPNVYMKVVEDKMTDVDTPLLGFQTNSKTKPLIIDHLRASLREGELVLNDKTTMQEMLTFVVKESGKLEAEQGCFDDCVMSLAIANHIHDGVWKPLMVSSHHYIENI
jgi:hypothetical protein